MVIDLTEARPVYQTRLIEQGRVGEGVPKLMWTPRPRCKPAHWTSNERVVAMQLVMLRTERQKKIPYGIEAHCGFGAPQSTQSVRDKIH